MYIQLLEIDNFLSYQHAQIEFGPRLNIITGLNGSGKSNIVSAFAFLFTKLYEGKMRIDFSHKHNDEDDIRVSVCFDNKTRRLPYDQDLVVLTKKLGKNATFYIDDELTSADRIDKMLMQINVSRTNHYNIVRQGRISDVLNMKQNDLYALLEEACGIKAYKQMRNEIDRNLTKLDAQSGLLKQQFQGLQVGLEQLKEDNQVFQRALVVSDQIKRLECQLSIKQLKDLDQQKNHARDMIIKLKNEVAKDQSEMKSIDMQIAELEQERKQINTNLQNEKHFYNNRLAEINKLQPEKQKILDEIQQIDYRVKQATDKSEIVSELKRKLRDLERISQEYQKQSDQYYKDIQLLQLTSSTDPVLTFNEKIKEYEKEIDQWKKEIQQLQDKINKVGQDIKVMEDSKQNKSLNEINEELQTAQQNLIIAQENLEQHKKDAVENSMLRTKNQQNIEQERQTLKTECERLNKDCNDQMALTLLDLYKFSKDKNIQLVGCLSDLIVVDKQFSSILELVAGRKLLTLIVVSLDDAEAIMKRNEEEKGGQINIFALELFEEDNSEPLNIPNCIDLTRYVKFNENFDFPNRTQLLNKIIGRWFIAPNFDQGIKVATKYGVDTVTQEGQIAYGGGYMTKVGQRMEDKDKIQTIKRILQCNNNIIKYETLDQIMTSKVDDDLNTTNTLMRDISTYKQEVERLTRIKESDYNQLNNKKGDLERLINLRDNLQEQVNITENRIKDIRTQLKNPNKLKKGFTQDHQKQMEKLYGERNQIIAKQKQCNYEINQTNQDIIANSTLSEVERNRYKLQQTQKQTELDELNVKIEQLQLENKRYLDLQAKWDQQIQKKKDEMEKKRVLKQGIEARLPTNEAEITHFEELLQDLEVEDQNIKKEISGQDVEANDKDDAQNIREKIKILNKNPDLKALKFGNQALFDKIEEIETGLEDYESKYDELVKSQKQFNEIVKKFDASSQDFAKHHMFKIFREGFEELFREMVGDFGASKLRIIHQKKDTYGIDIKVSFKDGQACLDWQTFSGGEKTIVALCIILSLQKVDPAPFYILDEFDAALDENYRENCAQCIKRLAQHSQFIIVSFRPELIKVDPENTRYFKVEQNDSVSYIERVQQHKVMKYVDNKNTRERTERQEKKNSKLEQDKSKKKSKVSKQYLTPLRAQQQEEEKEEEEQLIPL